MMKQFLVAPYRNLLLWVLALIALVFLWPKITPRLDEQPRSGGETIKTVASASETLPENPLKNVAPQQASLPFPSPSQQGTDIDGALHVDAKGNFIADADALRLFDYFLLDRTKLGDVVLFEQLKHYLQAQLEEPALSQALAFLAQYQSYENSLGSLPFLPEDASWHERYQQLIDARRNAFGDDLAAALFADEEAEMKASMARLNQSVQDTEQLPPAATDNMKMQQLKQDVMQLRQQGYDEGQVWQQRAKVFGSAAADRYQQLDQQREDWQQRFKAFKNAYQQAVAHQANSDELANLASQYFDEKDTRRALFLITAENP